MEERLKFITRLLDGEKMAIQRIINVEQLGLLFRLHRAYHASGTGDQSG